MLRRIALLALPLAFVACSDIATEAQEVVEARSWSDAKEEAGDVVDEIGDPFDPEERLEIEDELDRQADEIGDALDALGDKLAGKPDSELQQRLDELRTLRRELDDELDDLKRARADDWADAKDGVEKAIADLRKAAHDVDGRIEARR